MDMIKRFVRYYKPHKRLFMLDTACSLMVAVCDSFLPDDSQKHNQRLCSQ